MRAVCMSYDSARMLTRTLWELNYFGLKSNYCNASRSELQNVVYSLDRHGGFSYRQTKQLPRSAYFEKMHLRAYTQHYGFLDSV